MVEGCTRLHCGLICIWKGVVEMRDRYVLGQVKSTGRVLIGALRGRTVDSGLPMGRTGTEPVFCWFGASGFLMMVWFGDATLWTFFSLVSGFRRIVGRVYSRPGLLIRAGLN